MRKRFRTVIQDFFRSEVLKTRHELSFTQEEMAHLLFMSTRSYAAIESGNACCSLVTFLIFLTRYCFDPIDFLVRITAVLDDALDTQPEMTVSREWMHLRSPTPVRESPPYEDGEIDLLCPHCGAPIPRDFQPFCGQCAQALDWSEAFSEEPSQL